MKLNTNGVSLSRPLLVFMAKPFIFSRASYRRVMIGSSLLGKKSISTTKTNVVVIGSGAVGLLYGGRLLEKEISTQNDINVQFICRRDYNYIQNHGFQIRSPKGNFLYKENPLVGTDSNKKSKFHMTSDSIECKDEVDWIILAAKSYALHDPALSMTVTSLLSSTRQTKVLLLMNGLGCEEALLKAVPKLREEQVFGGMAFVCSNRISPSILSSNHASTTMNANESSEAHPILIDHLAHGGLLIGHYKDQPTALVDAKSLWQSTVIDTDVTTAECLLKARWMKLCWNMPFSGLSVSLGAVTTDVIATSPSLRTQATRILSDTIDLANADLREKFGSSIQHNQLIDKSVVTEHMWRLTDTLGAYKSSTAIDLSNNQDVESDFLFDTVLAKAIHHSKNKASVTGTDFPYLESMLLSVQGVFDIAKRKRARGLIWQPTYFD